MPIKMVQTKPAIKKSIKGSAKATAVLGLAVEFALGDGGDADEFGVELAAFLGDGDVFDNEAVEEFLAIARLLPSDRLPGRIRWNWRRHPRGLVADGAPGNAEDWTRGRQHRAACPTCGKTAPWRTAPRAGPRSEISKPCLPRHACPFLISPRRGRGPRRRPRPPPSRGRNESWRR